MITTEFAGLKELLHRFRELGASQLVVKPLSENDNSKQQIYFGTGFESLNLIPYASVRPHTGLKNPTFHATVQLSWIDAEGHVEPAKHTKLILYPRYPEVRLSGFLRGTTIAPTKDLQPLSPDNRKHNNAPDGRILVLGISTTKAVFAYLALRGSVVAAEFERQRVAGEFAPVAVFWTKPLRASADEGRKELLWRLQSIHKAGWHSSRRMTSTGQVVPYMARNGGGFTLEALLCIRPNSRAEPDFMGWEIKSFTGDRITLMTPEPDGGVYQELGFIPFMKTYGRYDKARDRFDFTGTHKVGVRQATSRQLLQLRGFDATVGKISDVSGGIELVDPTGNASARWSFASLIEHWGQKHAAAAYVSCEARGESREYSYRSPVQLGRGTDFAKFLRVMANGIGVYDPGCKLESASVTPRGKKRNQFRVAVRHLALLYNTFESVELVGR